MSLKRVWTCTACQREGFWGEGWNWYGSVADMDNGVDNLIITCSDACRGQADAKLKAGLWKLPTYTKTGMIRRQRKGY